jgi:hypothetical protein
MVEGERSTVTDVDSGVPQGTVLGPLLFPAFINDLPEVVSSPVRIFADDCLVYRSINKVEDTAALQNDMSALQQWESDWQMMFHPEKCTTIHISKKRNPIHTGYKLRGHTLESVPGSKYLGVHVNKDLSWNDNIQQTSAKASRSVVPTAELERLPSRRESPGLHPIGATSARVRFDSLGYVHAPTDLRAGTGKTSCQICHR